MEDEMRWIAKATGAQRVRRGERIQSLWSGYGEIFRVHLIGASVESVVVKWVKPPRQAGASVSHARKCRSYDVETAWYRTFAPRCDASCRVASLVDRRVAKDQWLLILEDLDEAGFPERRRDLGSSEIDACLAWLAAFHGLFLGVASEGLWKTGTYWHLATRQDELLAIEDAALREAAPLLDQKLRSAAFQTIVHGDAKPANFCFARGGSAVAAVDFQYAGGGCGMKDVAYLLSGSVTHGSAGEAQYLDTYFRRLREVVESQAPRTEVSVDALEAEWRALYPIACGDYYRFLAGWAKHHYAGDSGARRLVREVLRTLA